MFSTTNRHDAKIPTTWSHLRQVTTAQPPSTEEARGKTVSRGTDGTQYQSINYVCNLNIHDATLSKEDILVDMRVFAPHLVNSDDLMRMREIQGSSHHQYVPEGFQQHQDTDGRRPFKNEEDNKPPNESYLFRVKPMPAEMISKHPDLQTSVSSQIAAAFHLAKGSQVVLTSVDKTTYAASHVEIIFRDQYLARADMWRLVNSEMADKCLYKGQRIVFQGSIKAVVRSIYIKGRKAPSAHFSPSTKPIFRSESARYVLFVQMSKEMWEFDAEGTGEIMFDKVINGFLPDLFKRWEVMQAKHLLSIILFSRMVYDNPSADKERVTSTVGKFSYGEKSNSVSTQDFYRVVISDMPSAESASILDQLKREFKVFLRDTSIRKPDASFYSPIETGLTGTSFDMHAEIINGRPSIAAHGNILEAINLASSQFSADYIDRDLVRTGVSVVVVSPGSGLFEVDYDLLAATTDNLTENGVGIDLVCLSRMPLHSVPLFQYKHPHGEFKFRQKVRYGKTPPSFQSYETTSPSSFSPGSHHSSSTSFHGWSYGIPHWIDVSFWISTEEDQQLIRKRLPKSKLKSEELHGPRHKLFTPRIKMYELQMMGVMESGERETSIPQLFLGEGFASSKSGQPSITTNGSGTATFHLAKMSSFEIKADHLGSVNALSSASPSSNCSKSLAPLIRTMDEYDDLLFRPPLASRRRRPQRRPKQKLRRETQLSAQSADLLPKRSTLNMNIVTDENGGGAMGSGIEGHPHVPPNDKAVPVVQSIEAMSRPYKPNVMPRSISFGLRGLTPKATPTVTAQVDIAQSPAWTARTLSKSRTARSISTLSGSQRISRPTSSGFQSLSDPDSNVLPSSDSDRQDSRPIPIRNIDATQPMEANTSKGSSATLLKQNRQVHNRASALSDKKDIDPIQSRIEFDQKPKSLPPVLSPSTTLAPWLTILNPSNPSKTKSAETSRLGRWQHVFPRAPKSSQVKWKSLCSPAAIPLTTEEFPTLDELEEEYKRDSYVVTLPEEMDLSEHPNSLILELVAFRLSRGFQIVVGVRLAESQPATAKTIDTIFSEKMLGDLNSTVVLSRGSTIHRMTRTSIDRLEIEMLTRHSVAANDKRAEEKPLSYMPSIRSMLADVYEQQKISIMPHRGSFNWDMIDAFLAGQGQPQVAHFVENLRPWRVRFVLIPVDPPSTARRTVRSSEDNEEEIRLEGINKLTQLWQRFRFVPPEETGFRPQLRKTKDPNPLAISYQTKDPSAVIAAELGSVIEGDETGGPVQLLPEPELYQRSNFSLKTLAETLQGEKGVRMLDRRWHLRLHYSCFIGFELTTWLLQNFRDIETREEAEQLGKDLMRNGLLKHVEQRHDFRDGNYFYQIESDYRTPRAESKGWFGRGKSSVPSTPAVEKPIAELPRTARSRANSEDDTATEFQSPFQKAKKQQLRVALSKSLLYDVDHRRRSYRRELINLHFDRLHNPDNCYHIRIEWMNTTPRLIQEAVISWATNVERFGLRLVEVPIGEASSITATHPFRASYMVKLAQSPPTIQPQELYDTTSHVPQLKQDPLFYQKAILKYFNFVLDFEAASAFPSDVEVSYSWGKPDYRYPQYIHRSGVLIAQVTDEGHFLLLANRLYNNRSAGAKQSHTEPLPMNSADVQREPVSNPRHASAPKATHRPPSHPSLPISPRVGPTSSTNLDVPEKQMPFRGPSPTNISPTTSPRFLDRPGIAALSLEKITKDFETFCSSPAALQAFFTSVLSKMKSPTSTPSLVPIAVSTSDAEIEAPLLETPSSRIDAETQELPIRLLGGENGLIDSPGARERKKKDRESMKQEVKDAMKAAMVGIETNRLSGGSWRADGHIVSPPSREDA